MKSHVTLLTGIIREYGSWLHVKTVRDEATLRRRFENQNNWFLEVSLPTLDDALLRGLSTGQLQPITGYGLQSKTKLPKFLYGFWRLIFDEDGVLLASPNQTSIQAIRQVSRFCKKIKEVCNDDAVEAAFSGFIETDRALSQVRFTDRVLVLQEIAHRLFGRAIGKVFEEDLPYKHGPGAVADLLDGHERYSFSSVPDRLIDEVGMDVFKPFWWQGEPLNQEIPARLVAVPKTATKPRLISIEPAYNMYVQQGIHAVLQRELDKNETCGYASREPNRRLAREGSISGQLATIDLSEASDRVHYGVLKAMFGFNPHFLRLIDACRTRVVTFPDGRSLLLNKFASMGSALTFPLESMYFNVLVFYAIMVQDRDFSNGALQRLRRDRRIRIYGDDIIVPVEYVGDRKSVV